MSETSLIPSNVIVETVSRRNEATFLFEKFFEALEEAHKILPEAISNAAAACGGKFEWPHAGHDAEEVKNFLKRIKPPDVETGNRVCQRLIDNAIWASLIERTDLQNLMDRQAKDELHRQMMYVPERVDYNSGQIINQDEIDKGLPPISEESIRATLEQNIEGAETIWKRGIANVFSSLDRRFRSHDGFKIGNRKGKANRIILSNALDDYGGWNYNWHRRDEIIDIERIFLVLDGRSPTYAYGSIVEMVSDSRGRRSGPQQSQHEGDYFDIRCFKNGNAHLYFTRPDLVEEVNRLLAEWYGVGLGWGESGEAYGDHEDTDRPFDTAMQRAPAKNFGFFPTPESVVDKVYEAASIARWRDEDEVLKVLEPSAGTGNLARKAVAIGHDVTCVEIQPELAWKLQEENAPNRLNGEAKPYSRVIEGDFLKLEQEPVYDVILMNPPFDQDRDIDHVHHALGFLKPGGQIVAIMSASTEFATSKKAVALRAKLETMRPGFHRWGSNGYFQDLPAGSFEGTNVNTVLVNASRPA